MQASIDRYLRERGYKFTSSKVILEGKARVICEDGKGSTSNKSSSVVPSS